MVGDSGTGTGVHVEVRGGAYHDSVTLLGVGREVAGVDGVRDAQVAMATPLNLDVLAGMGMAAPDGTRPDDLVVAVRVEAGYDRGAVVAAALARLDEALAAGPEPVQGAGGAAGEPVPHTTGGALARTPAPLALVSVPGDAAFAEALDAVRAGTSVVVFSDNVPVAQEIALKDAAAAAGVLVMGPDCGTALVGGVGLGFVNVVEPGPVSLVAASGTGAQHLMALLGAAGVGVRHCLGLGGRDLTAAVGGRSARVALDALQADPGTELVVVVSKPPDPDVLAALRARTADRAVVWAALGDGQPDLTVVAADVLARLGRDVPAWPEWAPTTALPAAPGRALRGLFCGGTLCDEAMVVAAATLGPIASNVPLAGAPALTVRGGGYDAGTAHAMVDFGDDAFTQGRAHPMIDPTLRTERLRADGADPRVGAVLVDVVLGHGSHPDPAADLAPAIAAAAAPVVVSLTGTRGDPQDRDRQAEALAAAGAHVHLSNAAAAAHAASLVAPSPVS